MSIRTTLTLDDDILERVKEESRMVGASYSETLNQLLRLALTLKHDKVAPRTLTIKPFQTGGLVPGLSYDNTEALLAYGEGEEHR